jgi:hypothetical protein
MMVRQGSRMIGACVVAAAMTQFMDEFDAAGLIPVSLLRWELTGTLPEDIARMLERVP